MSTGINSRRPGAATVAAVLLLFTAGSSHAQTFKLSSLRLPPDVPTGTWVSYQITVVAKNRPPRRLTQRISVVSREGAGAEAGAWVELKTAEAGRTRTERGFFMHPEASRALLDTLLDDIPALPEHASAGQRAPRFTLARYQKLTPDGKLYEYPVDEESGRLPEEDVSAMDMFEFGGRVSIDTLPPDTLRAGRKVIPCQVRRVRRFGSQEWEGNDSSAVNRAVMVQTTWRNEWVPITSYARRVMELSSQQVRRGGAPADTAASALPDSAATAASAADSDFYRAEITLLDLGNDAVPEITQAPEPAPQGPAPRPRTILK